MPQAPALRDASQTPEVARLVTLHHRRRGWAWVATASVIGLAVYAGLDANLRGSLTGAAATLSVIPVFVLLALVVVGLVVVIVDTTRIHRADEAVRVTAKAGVSHYPIYAHAHRWPPRHPGSWAAALLVLLAMTCITAYMVPQEVNAWAYVLGAEQQDTFNPVSYSTSCQSGTRFAHCSTMTVGYLSRSGEHAYWGPEVPLGQPFSVRDPLWAWGTGRNLINGDGSAIPDIVAGLFFDAVTLLLLYVLVVLLRETSPRRNQRAPVPAGADPDTVHPARHPGRAHHADGTRRRAGRGRR
jgi:hypothetical protein